MTTPKEEIHARKVEIVTTAVVSLLERFGPQGLTSTAIFEGAVKAAAVVMIGERGASTDDVADLLEQFATALRGNGPDEIARH